MCYNIYLKKKTNSYFNLVGQVGLVTNGNHDSIVPTTAVEVTVPKEIKRSVRTTDAKVPMRKFSCSSCPKKFSQERDMQLHLVAIHKSTILDVLNIE